MSSTKKKIGIFGSTGYTGLKLIDLILQRQDLEIVFIGSEQLKGQKFSKTFPQYQNLIDLNFSGLDDEFISSLDATKVNLIFFATPNGICYKYAPKLIDKGIHVIDLSADYRFRDLAIYEKYYGFQRDDTEHNNKAIYGLVEFNSAAIRTAVTNAKKEKKAVLIGNPGCYTTASILALTPLLLFAKDKIDYSSIIVDGKSGISGAGRKAELKLIYSELNESCSPYNLGGKHRHTPELEVFFSGITGTKISLSFSPHLIPMTQGLLVTCYVNLKDKIDLKALKDFYKKTYKDFIDITVLEDGVYPQTQWTVNNNKAFIQIDLDSKNNRMICTCALDNLVKGAAGQALQNMDLILD